MKERKKSVKEDVWSEQFVDYGKWKIVKTMRLKIKTEEKQSDQKKRRKWWKETWTNEY